MFFSREYLRWDDNFKTVSIAGFDAGMNGDYRFSIAFELWVVKITKSDGSTWDNPAYEISETIDSGRRYYVYITVGRCFPTLF